MKKLRSYFITGLAVFLPIAITIYILVVAFRFFDNILGRFINIYLLRTGGIYIPGLGLILFILVVFLAGIFTRHFFGRKLFPFFEKILLLKPPLIRQIYPSVKKIINLILSQEKPSFKKAVLVEYPRKGIYSLGFVANEGMKEARDKTNTDDLVNVLIPSSPSPFSGYLIMVPKKELIYLDISIEKAFELIISDGVLNPEDIADKPV